MPIRDNPGQPPTKGVFRLRGLEMTRIETFTDAAFAFALTLLVISLDPPTSAAALQETMREIPAFVASGVLLMMFWWGHHEWSRRYGLDDGRTLILSCVLVFTVLVYVVPLRFMFGLLFVWIGSLTGLPVGSPRIQFTGLEDVNTMFVIYGFGFAAMAGSLALLYLHAWRERDALGLSPAEAFETLADGGQWAIVASTGIVSALLAAALPPSPVGLPGWVYMVLPVATPTYTAWLDRRRGTLPATERRTESGSTRSPRRSS